VAYQLDYFTCLKIWVVPHAAKDSGTTKDENGPRANLYRTTRWREVVLLWCR
jgi:hypothetical protein